LLVLVASDAIEPSRRITSHRSYAAFACGIEAYIHTAFLPSINLHDAAVYLM
jgi:hypothetical protein